MVRAVNDLLERALELRASDIHIEPFRTGLVVRMRVDGILRAVPFSADAPPQAVVSRIKILAGLNIAERRLPQDGAARARAGRSEIDIRIATMPTQHGESVVIRLLPRDRGLLELSKIGLFGRDEATLRRLLALPVVLAVVLSAVFLCLLSTGDPVELMAPPSATAADKAQMRHQFGGHGAAAKVPHTQAVVLQARREIGCVRAESRRAYDVLTGGESPDVLAGGSI